PANGILIGTIGANSSRTVSFQFSLPTIPIPNSITNQSITTFQYIYYSSKPILTHIFSSNTLHTTINNSTISSLKSSYKHFSNLNYIITYTTTLTNNFNTLSSNLIFPYLIPNLTSFIPNIFPSFSYTPLLSHYTIHYLLFLLLLSKTPPHTLHLNK
ncbi:hypothetical protein FO496_29465, partial [Bacillus paranthracis]|nr:hypothetical protein [Bacillus paranthracis]